MTTLPFEYQYSSLFSFRFRHSLASAVQGQHTDISLEVLIYSLETSRPKNFAFIQSRTTRIRFRAEDD